MVRVVVLLCMHVEVISAPSDGATSTEYEISNRRFSDFLRNIIVIF